MGYIGIEICDFCGRRTEKPAGWLTLHKLQEHQKGIGTTARRWKICVYCFRKLSGMKTFGDDVKEAIEVQLDKIRGDNSNVKLLENINRG